MYKLMKDLKKQTNILFNMANKSISWHEMNNVNNTKKASYINSRRDEGNVSSDLDYKYYSISYHSD